MAGQSISVQAEEARGCLAQIRQVIEQYRELSAKVQGMRDELSSCWKGNSAIAMQNKIQEWMQRQEAEAARMEQKASAVEAYISGMEELDAKLAGML